MMLTFRQRWKRHLKNPTTKHPIVRFAHNGDPEKEKAPFPFAREHPITHYVRNGDPELRADKSALAETKVYFLRRMSAKNIKSADRKKH